MDQEHAYTDFRTQVHCHRDEELVGNAVLKSTSNKGKDGQPGDDSLTDYVFCSVCLKDCQADEPVA